MKKPYAPPKKKSKREQKKANATQRLTWGEFNPTPRIKESAKTYNRKKSKHLKWHSHEKCLDFCFFHIYSSL